MEFKEPYTPPTVTVDSVILQLNKSKLEVLLIKRSNDPFKDMWALPGGYSAAGNTTIDSLTSVLKRKTGLSVKNDLTYIEQLYTFDTIARDPRGHAISVTYLGCGRDIKPKGGSDTWQFFTVDDLPKLAFDHSSIIKYAHERLIAKLTYTNVVSRLLEKKFTLTQLQTAYEVIMEKSLDKRNFRKKFLSLNMIHETNEIWREGAHRPAKMYEFNSDKFETLSQDFE